MNKSKRHIRLSEHDFNMILKESVDMCLKRYLSEEAEYYDEDYNELSDFLENGLYDDCCLEDIWEAVDEGDSEQTRLNLIDNGYCITVCMLIDYNFEGTPISNDIEFYLLDDGGESYHCFAKYDGKFYDAYNYMGVTRLSDLQFCKIYMSNYDEDYLRKYLKFISKGEFDDVKANELIDEMDELKMKNQEN